MTWRAPHRASSARAVNIWPGFVDALSALLMVVIFVLMVFMVAQFYLSNVLTGREDLLGRLNDRIAELNAQVDLERQENADLRARFAELSDDLQITVSERDALSDTMSDLQGERDDLASRLSRVLAANEDLLSEIDMLDAQLLTASDTIDADRETIELQLRDIARLEADIRALSQTKDVLEAELASLGLALQASRSEAEQLGVSLDEQTSLAALLRDDLASAERDNLALTDSLSDLESQRVRLMDSIAALEAEQETLTRSLEDQELQLAAMLEAEARLQETLSGTEEALALSEQSVETLTETVGDQREQLARRAAALALAEASLVEARESLDVSQASVDALTGTVAEQRQRLSLRAAALTALEEALAEREATIVEQGQDLADRDRSIDDLTGRLQLSGEEVIALRQVLEERGADLAALQDQLADSQAAEAAVGEEVDALTLELRITEEDRQRIMEELGAVRDRSRVLETELSSAEERTVLMQTLIDEQETQLAALAGSLSDSEQTRASEQELAAAQIDALNAQLDGLRSEIRQLQQALTDTEATVSDQDLEITSLTSRLNQALVQRVEELGRYRSEFFGRLRSVLGSRTDIRVVGDRFVFQSEVLFASGSATLQASGADELGEFADTLLELTAEFPPEVDWILRVDGHTDIRPISTAAFRSNWELSTARALEVVEFLESRGIPPERLAAAGFGEFQPLDPRPTESAYQRNRRIELKLDQR